MIEENIDKKDTPKDTQASQPALSISVSSISQDSLEIGSPQTGHAADVSTASTAEIMGPSHIIISYLSSQSLFSSANASPRSDEGVPNNTPGTPNNTPNTPIEESAIAEGVTPPPRSENPAIVDTGCCISPWWNLSR